MCRIFSQLYAKFCWVFAAVVCATLCGLSSRSNVVLATPSVESSRSNTPVTQSIGTHPSRLADSRGAIVKRVKTDENVVALTFDDGPSRTFTPQILRVLERYHAKATFFVIGSRILENRDIIARELRDDEEVGNHTYHHVNLARKNDKDIIRELRLWDVDFLRTFGKPPSSRLVRPPRGHWDTNLAKTAKASGYTLVLWSIDSRDWSNPGTGRIVSTVLSRVRGGDILMFHDQGGNRKQTIQALQVIIPRLKADGYRFVTVSELLSMQRED